MSYYRLADAGIPPGVDAAEYSARLATLEDFADQAAEEYNNAPLEAAARYTIIREETGNLFSQLNRALGTSLRLP